MNMRSFGLVGAGVVVCALAAMTQDPKPAAAANPAAERYAIAKEVCDEAKVLRAAGRGGFPSAEEELKWLRRLAESAVAAGIATPAQAYGDYAALLQEKVAGLEELYKAGRAQRREVNEMRWELALAKELAAAK
jgi:hypothetical protein